MTLLSTPTPEENRRPHVVPLQFWTEYEPDPSNPGGMRAVDFVKWGRRGDLIYGTNVDKVARVRRPMVPLDDRGAPVENPVWAAIRPAYEAWKQGQEAPPDGTPLDAWPAVNPAQVKALREAHYRSVEHVAAMTDNELARVRLPNMRGLRDRARAYVEAKKGEAHVEAALASRDKEIADLKATIGELTDMLRLMQQQQAAGPQPGDATKPAERPDEEGAGDASVRRPDAPPPSPPPRSGRGRVGGS